MNSFRHSTVLCNGGKWVWGIYGKIQMWKKTLKGNYYNYVMLLGLGNIYKLLRSIDNIDHFQAL